MLPLAVNVLALITLALPILPPDPVVLMLVAVIFPDAIKVLAEMTLTLLILPPDPLLNRLPTVVLPVAFSVPATFIPVPVTINIFALPATLVVTLPFAVTTTLLFPFTIVFPALTVIPVNKLPLPLKKFAVTRLPKFALPAVILPEAVKVLADMTLALVILPPLPLATKLPTVAFPVTVKLPNVPTVVRLDVTIEELSVVPVKLAALAVIAVLDAAVNWP